MEPTMKVAGFKDSELWRGDIEVPEDCGAGYSWDI
jgi:hypothetical protein